MDIEKRRDIEPYSPEIDRSRPDRTPERQPPSGDRLYKVFRKQNSRLEIVQNTGFHSGPMSRRRSYQLVMWSWLASFIDALILISISCVFLLAFSYIVRSGGAHFLHDVRIEKSLQRNFVAVFLLCSWVYMVTLRVLTGSSVGEWACDLRLGKPHERIKTQYPLRVILRESLVLITGLVILPLLSLISGRDIAGKLSGLQLFSLK